MKCFEVVQKVLDATYAELPGTGGARDQAISRALEAMSRQYNKNLLSSGGPDFSDPVTRFAYVFLYVPAHAHWLYELITWSSEAKSLFDAQWLRMACLGGGAWERLGRCFEVHVNAPRSADGLLRDRGRLS